MDISWHRKPHGDSHPQPHDGSRTIAISAFFLSTLETPWRRKKLVKEMWESGAGTIVSRLIAFDIFIPNPCAQVLLDHSSPTGFQNIAVARELLLDLGRKEMENGENSAVGSHVLAPVRPPFPTNTLVPSC